MPEAVDHQGATALHVAAEKGMIEVCWLLLKSAGLHILHMKNHTGLTPLDLCNQGNTFRSVENQWKFKGSNLHDLFISLRVVAKMWKFI